MTLIRRWPASHTKRAPQKVHPLPARPSLVILRPPPLKLRRSVHPPVTQLRAIDLAPVLLRAERDAPLVIEVPSVAEGARIYREVMARADAAIARYAMPAPVAAPQPAGARFVVGDRVRGYGVVSEKPYVGTVESVQDDCLTLYECEDIDAGRRPQVLAKTAERIEPLPSETPESGDWTPPAPWVVDSDGDYGYGAKYMETGAARRIARDQGSFIWFDDAERKRRSGREPTLAQACCAALSIQISEYSRGYEFNAQSTLFEAELPDGTVLVHNKAAIRDAESCARLALAAHARLVSR